MSAMLDGNTAALNDYEVEGERQSPEEPGRAETERAVRDELWPTLGDLRTWGRLMTDHLGYGTDAEEHLLEALRCVHTYPEMPQIALCALRRAADAMIEAEIETETQARYCPPWPPETGA